jgi:catechol 2,3-dioxygenase-like lactoylglutathione lyase family enzyme
MRALALNHVSVPARDLVASERFYCEVLGMERLPSPNFGFPTRWLRLGDLQVHLQQLDTESARRSYQHFGIEVSDFAAAYRTLRDLDAFEDGTRYANVWLLPSNELQMWVRDPSENLIEIVWSNADTIDLSLFAGHLRVLADEVPQSVEERRATLFCDRRSSVVPG